MAINISEEEDFSLSGYLSTLVLMGLLAFASGVAASPLKVSVPNNAPFATVENGQVSGVLAEIAAHVLTGMGYELDVQVLPFKRAYHQVHKASLDVAMSVLATPKRITQAHYSNAIIFEYTLILVNQGSAFKFQTLGDLKGKKLGARLGFKYPELAHADVQLDRHSDYQSSIKKLHAGRLDGVLVGSLTGPYLLQQLGMTDQFDYLPTAVSKVPLGIAVSYKMWDYEQLEQFNTALRKFENTLAWQRIISTNGVTDWVRQWPLVKP
jgi:polar amino acid transport system substrate-binding protein